jgi:lipopolysaccharide/colanic/teichoic acid biosynthesis glycosyltransferase
MWKRALDVTCCIAALPLLVVVTCALTVVMMLFSKGPVLFRQRSIGYMGRSFGAYRFRTMHAARRKHAPQIPGEDLNAQAGTARLIPGGSFLRSSGLVDLPQIVNVLRGEMSIVGLRPCCDFDDPSRAAAHRNDLAAVPGLTGVWRLAGENSANSDEAIRWEKAYFSNLSFFGDLKVIALSLFAIFRFRRTA